MFLNHILLGFLGIAFGGAVAAGTFAFVIVIGVVPRMIGKCNRAANTLYFEQAIILGGILGNIVSVFLQMHIPLGQVSGHIFLGLYGLSAGMFVGCIAVALAEILNTFPILFRRAKLKVGLQWVMWTMAVGKTCGALYYFVKKSGKGCRRRGLTCEKFQIKMIEVWNNFLFRIFHNEYKQGE